VAGAGMQRLKRKHRQRGIAASTANDPLAGHLEVCLRGRPALKKHPVVATLLDLYVSRLKMLIALPIFVRLFDPGIVQLYSELEELGSWLFKKRHRAWKREERDEGEAVLKNPLLHAFHFHPVQCSSWTPEEFGKELTEVIIARGSGGRPPSRRPVAIAALELKLTKPSLSWAEVTRAVCDCGKSRQEHDGDCKAKVDARLKELRVLLRKYKKVL
jgi:hypothetical protein